MIMLSNGGMCKSQRRSVTNQRHPLISLMDEANTIFYMSELDAKKVSICTLPTRSQGHTKRSILRLQLAALLLRREWVVSNRILAASDEDNPLRRVKIPSFGLDSSWPWHSQQPAHLARGSLPVDRFIYKQVLHHEACMLYTVPNHRYLPGTWQSVVSSRSQKMSSKRKKVSHTRLHLPACPTAQDAKLRRTQRYLKYAWDSKITVLRYCRSTISMRALDNS